MSTFNLGLPLDIPWKRLCYTEDMTHANICRDQPPPAWRPSIAVFGYEPDVEYQTLAADGYTISYVKVTVTITPDSPVLGAMVQNIASGAGGTAAQVLQKTSPCYGALMHVSIAPRGGGQLNQIYFADVEPKKRELYESVTDTGQFASGSQTRLAVGKSAMTSDSTESFSSTTAGINLSIPILDKGGIGGSISNTTGDRSTHMMQQADTTSTDRSTERREMQSHTTQLSQMYNLFQAFHVGTNRALFFMEPRPHILSNTATFINGPRALEGMQDVFLVVVRKSTITDFCVNVRLESAHLNTSQTKQQESDVAVFEVDFTADVPPNTPVDRHEYGEVRRTYAPPPGWIIDMEKTKAEAVNIIEDEPGWAAMTSTAKVESVTPREVNFYGRVSWHTFVREEDGAWGQTPGHLRFNLTIFLTPAQVAIQDYVDQIYVLVRTLCCCSGEEPTDHDGGGDSGGGDDPGTIPPTDPPTFDPNNPCAFIWDLLRQADPNSGPEWLKKITWPTNTLPPHQKQEIANGTATDATLQSSTAMAKWMRDMLTGLLKMSTAPTWIDCPVPFTKSDPFFTRSVEALSDGGAGQELSRTLSTSTVLPQSERTTLSAALGDVQLATMLRTNSAELAKLAGRPLYEVVQLKEQVILALSAASAPAMPSSVTPLPRVIGVTVGTTVPDPENPRMLLSMTDPHQLLRVPAGEQANVVDIAFSDRPNDGQVTSSSIVVKHNGSSISTDVRMIAPAIARIYITTALTPGELYTVTVRGSGGTAITFGTLDLDGEPLGLPSGDGIAGGDFVFGIQPMLAELSIGARKSAPFTVTDVMAQSAVSSPAKPLALMSDPGTILDAPASQSPNQFLVRFNYQPDLGTVTTSSVSVTKDGAAVTATVVLGSDKTATIKITDAVVTGALYVVTLKGTGTTPITYLGSKLDGAPNRLPSGNGYGGSDFVFVFRATADVALPTPAIPAQRLRVIGVRMLNVAASPSSPILVSEMIHPGSVQVVRASAAADTIEVEFGMAPDSGAVDSDSFIVTQGTAALLGTVTQPSARIARFTASAPFTEGKSYQVTLKGDGAHAITSGSVVLDGDPLRLPSGDGTDGGDFTFVLAVAPAPPEISVLPLLKVKGVKFLSTFPDAGNPRLVGRMLYASDIVQVLPADKVDIIDLDLSQIPDTLSVTDDTVVIGWSGGTIGHHVTTIDDTTLRVVLTDPLSSDTTYTIVATGDAPDALTYQGRRLDGEAFAFPSGNGLEGGSFICKLQVLA
ncbi:MAG TPA: hypothetical protein VHI13_06235 [Candidatus Kapabacteria bacterium]|nr:hypothetical protein [Candidatus Kapabacteria bacterium]